MATPTSPIFTQWLQKNLDTAAVQLHPLPGDASFRRYFRVQGAHQPCLAVISPPATENNVGFIQIAQAFAAAGLQIPTVFAADLTQGFFLLRDFGDDVLFQKIKPETADYWYTLALNDLAKIQGCQLTLLPFDAQAMGQELHYFREWLVEKHLHLSLSPAIDRLLQRTFARLLQSAAAQPQCCIHRDYHSRNLMMLPDNQLGILDFQDAMIGPITYDLVSLIRDCYIVWPKSQVLQWAELFYENTLKKQIPSKMQFFEWVDLMGMQRHLKASFIFARKFRRDQTHNYLADLPRTLQYVLDVSENYAEFNEFRDWLNNEIVSRLLLAPNHDS